MPKTPLPSRKQLRAELTGTQLDLQRLQARNYKKPMQDFNAQLRTINARAAAIVQQLGTLDILREYKRRMKTP